jgi:type III pantothenate kinase
VILTIDLGNTNIVIGVMEGDELRFTARFSTDRAKTADEYALMFDDLLELNNIKPEEIEGGIIASVVPDLKNELHDAVEMVTGKRPLTATIELDTGLVIDMDTPSTLGADLLVNSVAALNLYPLPILIFDMGTATKLSVIDCCGHYSGGMIIPGLRLSTDALSARTAQLPRISLDEPKILVGKNTVDCMQSGVIYGNPAMLDGIIDRVEAEMGKKATILATGGLIELVAPFCRHKMIVDKNLTLRGLRILYDRNADKAR